jgi:hypothetical protein
MDANGVQILGCSYRPCQYATRMRKPGEAVTLPPARGKYNNRKVLVDGMRFDSVGEYEHWLVLKDREAAGEISDLRRQVVYELAPAVVIDGKRKPRMTYKADYVYVEGGREVVADWKGVITRDFRVRQHLMMERHGIDILVVRKEAAPRRAVRRRRRRARRGTR